MFVRKKHNKSGTTSVVVVSKCSGRYKEINSFGFSSSQEEINGLIKKANDWIYSCGNHLEFDFDDRKGHEIESQEGCLQQEQRR